MSCKIIYWSDQWISCIPAILLFFEWDGKCCRGTCIIFHELPVGGRHASRNIAETIRCGFFIAKNLDCVQWLPLSIWEALQWKRVECCFLHYRVGGFLQKILVMVWTKWRYDDACLTYAWQVLDICLTILTFTLCVWKACRRLKQNSKDCQAFFSHNGPFCWASVDWVYKAMFRVKLSTRSTFVNVYADLLHHLSFCDRHASRNVVAKTVRRGWRFLSVFIVCGRLWQNKGNENHMRFTWKPYENSSKNQKWFDDFWCGLHSTGFLRCPLFSCLIFSGQLTCRCPSWVSAKTFRHGFPVSTGSR